MQILAYKILWLFMMEYGKGEDIMMGIQANRLDAALQSSLIMNLMNTIRQQALLALLLGAINNKFNKPSDMNPLALALLLASGDVAAETPSDGASSGFCEAGQSPLLKNVDSFLSRIQQTCFDGEKPFGIGLDAKSKWLEFGPLGNEEEICLENELGIRDGNARNFSIKGEKVVLCMTSSETE